MDNWGVRRLRMQDIDSLFSFRKRIFPPEHQDLNRDYWKWKFIENPYSQEIPFFVVESNGRIVGTQGYVPFPMSVDGREPSSSYLVDFNVEKSFNPLVAVKLYKKVISCSSINIAANLSEDARRFFRSARFVDLSDNVHRLKYSLKAGNDRYSARVKYWLFSALREVKRCKLSLNQKFERSNQTISIAESMPDGIEKFWSLMAQRYKIFIKKDRTYLMWRYVSHPLFSYHFAALHKQNQLKAVLVLYFQSEPNQQKCWIMDVLYDPSDDFLLGVLVNEVIKYCRDNEIQSIDTELTSPSLAKIFIKVGFRVLKNNLGLMIHSQNGELLHTLCLPGGICFVPGDTDRF